MLRNVAKCPLYLPVMAHKVFMRLKCGHGREAAAATAWAAEKAEDLGAWGRRVDEFLWRESELFAASFAESAWPRVRRLAPGVELGGAAGVELLYFLTRKLCPETVVETGVAAGWSSAAVLTGISENGKGHLYSSDFPFFRLPCPERYIGLVVPGELKGAWTLHIDGDRRNLKRILRPETRVDLVHYDSDKTREGRQFFLRRIRPHLAARHILVMDDIQDNLVFREYVRGADFFRVFEYQGKYIGMTGPGLADLERGEPAAQPGAAGHRSDPV
jgi:predicted O-methyltransferase YrrM